MFMDFDWIWKSILIVVAGTLLLRVAGRKSISQMTLAQTVIMVAIGSLLIQPVAGKNVWVTFGVGAVLVITLIAIEYGQIKSDIIERFITGKAVPLIENGTLNEKNLGKLRFTVDQLEMKLRQQNISSIDQVKSATLEPNGQIGYRLKQSSQAATKQDIDDLRNEFQQLKDLMNGSTTVEGTDSHSMKRNQKLNQLNQTLQSNDIFSEVDTKTHPNDPPDRLE